MPGDRLTSLLIAAFAPDARSCVSAASGRSTISFDAERLGGAIEIKASAVLKADAATAWCVLTDYGRYADYGAQVMTYLLKGGIS